MTCLHSECGTNSQNDKENYERDQSGGRRAVARVRDRPDNYQEEERAEELQREERTDELDNRGNSFCRAHLIEEAVPSRHVWRLNGASERIRRNQLRQLFWPELTAYEEKSDAVPGTVRMPFPPSNKSIAWA